MQHKLQLLMMKGIPHVESCSKRKSEHFHNTTNKKHSLHLQTYQAFIFSFCFPAKNTSATSMQVDRPSACLRNSPTAGSTIKNQIRCFSNAPLKGWHATVPLPDCWPFMGSSHIRKLADWSTILRSWGKAEMQKTGCILQMKTSNKT